MLEFDRIDVDIDINKTSASKECKICHYWYFKDNRFKYELYLCNSCHGLMQKVTLVLIMLLFFMLKEVLTEFTLGI